MWKYLLYISVLVISVNSESTALVMNSNTGAKYRLDKGSIALSGEFLYQLSRSKPDHNFVISAVSIMMPLAQITLFARDLVLKQLLRVLNLRNKHEIKSVYFQETRKYKNQKNVDCELASRYFANKMYPLSENFIRKSKKYFNASGENVDFSKKNQAARTINLWVSNKTHGKIQHLVSPDSLDANSVMVLVNAIYFLGNWVHPFNQNNTHKRDFKQQNNHTVRLDTMYQENTFKYAENQKLKLQVLEMPYKNNNFSFVVILPEMEAFKNTVSILRDPNVFISILNSLSYQKVKVYLPKILIRTKMDMANLLQKANVTEMFKPGSDGFEGILKYNQPLHVSSATQKAFIRCDEIGTEAAAATDIVMSRSLLLPSPEIVFKADHPFLFYLLSDNKPLFSGAFVTGQLFNYRLPHQRIC